MLDIIVLYFVYMSATRDATVALPIQLPPPRRLPQGQWLGAVGILSQGHTETDSLVVLPVRIPSPDVSPSEIVALAHPKVSVFSIHSSSHTTLWTIFNATDEIITLWNTFDATDEITDAWTPLRPICDSQIHPTSLVGKHFVSGIFWPYHDKLQQHFLSPLLQGNNIYSQSTKDIDLVQNQQLRKEVKPVPAAST